MTKVTLPVLIVPMRQKCKPPKALPPVPYWAMKKARLVRAGKRTISALQRSTTIKMAAEIAVGVCMTKILDPKGAFITGLAKNKTWGSVVTAVVAHEQYQQFAQRLTENSVRFVSSGFAEQAEPPVIEKDITPVTNAIEALAKPSWSTTLDDTQNTSSWTPAGERLLT